MIKRFTSREDVFEVAYRISKDSDYAKEYARYERDEKRRLELCEKFAKEKGITGSKFAIAGDGSVNMPFNESQKRNIYFFIEDNELNRERFKGSLKKKSSLSRALRVFSRNSEISKEFAKRCIDECIVVNNHNPDAWAYLEDLKRLNSKYKYSLFESKDFMYMKIDMERSIDITAPEGFEEIPVSEFYFIYENLKEGKKDGKA